jgi:tetratricopeptide (TPR) repeat protein
MISGNMQGPSFGGGPSASVFCGKRGAELRLVTLALALALLPVVSLADVIYLKNGRNIVAQVTREDSKQVFYEVAGGEFAVPRSIVDHIEKSPEPTPPATPGERPPQAGHAREMPLPPPPGGETASENSSPVIKDGAIDEAYLQHLDNEMVYNPSPENGLRLKQSYQQAAVFLTRQGDPEAAIEKYRQALKFFPDDLPLTLALGYLLVTQNHYLEAVDLLLPAADHHPKSPDLHLLLGSAFYGQENLDQAIAEWNKALAIADNPRLKEAIAKAERERDVAASYMELRSEHFLLRYEGREVEKLSNEVLDSLEGSFRDLVLDLDYSPREVIIILLYPSQAFRDITRSPSWVGAMNDGKVRIPISGLTTVNAELARVLKHELTHSFIRQITLGHCPTWFNEGLAQLEEGATTAALGTQLAHAMATGRVPSLLTLEAPFVNLPPDQVRMAYAESLAALEYLRDAFGQGEIRRLLKTMPSNPDMNSLLQDELRLSYPAFEPEVANYIVKRYGS